MAHFSSGEFAEFNRLLATAVEHGLGLESAVALLEGQARRPSVREGLRQLGRALQEGRPLHEALLGPPPLASPEYAARIRAGQESGNLASVLRAAETYHALKSRVLWNFWKLILYLFLIFVFWGIVAALVAWISRSIGVLYGPDPMTLPLPLRILHWSLKHLGALLGILIVVFGLAYLTLRRLGRTRIACRIAYGIPVLGPILRARDLGTFCSILGMGLRGGGSLPEQFDLAGNSIKNRYAKSAVGLARKRVAEGERLSSALYYVKYFPRSLAWGISLGEARGDVSGVLETFARLYGAALERSFEALFQILTPLGILATAHVVYGAALGVLLPLVSYRSSFMSYRSYAESDTILGPLLILDGCFLLVISLAYVLVTRRREKIFLLVEHLSGWVAQGLPLPMGLRVLGQDIGGLFGLRMTRVASRLGEGATLSESLAAEPGAFPPLLRRMVALGEKSGNMRPFLESVATTYRRIVEPPQRSIYFFLYPLGLTLLINLWLVVLIPVIHRWVTAVFLEMRVHSSMLGLESWLTLASRILLVLAIAVVTFFCMGGASAQFGISPIRSLRSILDRLFQGIPILRRVIRDNSLHAFCFSTAQFLRAGATVAEAVRATAEAETNAVYRRRYEKLARDLEEGHPFSKGARRVSHFDEDFLWMARTGEAAGDLPEQLFEGAMLYETRSRYFAALAARASIPLLVVVNGALVLGMCLLVFVPLTDLMKGIGPW